MKVPIKIDNKPFEVEEGITILDACKQIGIKIPSLCYHPDLNVAGICRICVVEIEGMAKLQAACAYPVAKNMSIKTNSTRVRKARRINLDLILSEHYGDCYTCFRNGNCELQSLAKEFGVDHYRFPHVQKKT